MDLFDNKKTHNKNKKRKQNNCTSTLFSVWEYLKMSKTEKKFEGKWLIKILKPDGEVAITIKDYGVKQLSDVEEKLTFDDENKRKISLIFDKKKF
jgi:hypothetical protein